MLRMIQLNTLEDRCIKEKHNWDEAAQFLISSLEQNLKVLYNYTLLYNRLFKNFILILLY